MYSMYLSLFDTICMYRSFLSGYRIMFLIGFKKKVFSHHLFVSALDHFWPLLTTFGLLSSHKERLLRSLCTVSQYLLVITSAGRFRYFPLLGSAWQVPESATQDDVAEEPVKSPEACG